MNESKWHCLHTKAGGEKKAFDYLKKKGFDAYYPVTFTGASADRRKLQSVPLFRTYVFVKMTDADLPVVLRSDAVLSMVHWLGNPVTLRDNEIQLIRIFLGEHSKVTTERTKVNTTEMVRIITDHTSEPTSNSSFAFTNPVKIILPSLGYAIVADVPVTKVETFMLGKKAKGEHARLTATP